MNRKKNKEEKNNINNNKKDMKNNNSNLYLHIYVGAPMMEDHFGTLHILRNHIRRVGGQGSLDDNDYALRGMWKGEGTGYVSK